MIGNLTGESFLIALSGMVIVFLMLAILCLFIPVISKCVRFFEKRRQKPEPVRPAPAAVPQADPAPAAAQQAGVWGGEVALIVAQKGLAVGLIPPVYFTAVILLIMVSSIVTPVALKLLYRKEDRAAPPSDPVPAST